MLCDLNEHLLGSYLDAELDAAAAARVEQHLETCGACKARLEHWRALRTAIGKAGPAPMPASLAERVARGIEETRQTLAAEPSSGARPVQRRTDVPGLLRQAAALLIACGLTAAGTWWAVSSGERARLAQRELLSAHIRTLVQDTPVQIASAEGHVVRPWLAGKVDVAPPVKDLSAQGFPLVGGRIDYIAGRRVAALVYKRRLHVINVFAWPDATISAPRLSSAQGYSILSWSGGGIGFSAVSDLNGVELQELQRLLQ